MGIIRAVTDAVSGALADQWLEVIEPDQMSDRTVFTAGVQMRQGERNSNTKRTSAVVSNGSVIHVYPNQFMLLVDGGKIVDYTAEEGYYTVNNSSEPSLFNGDLGDSVKESFNRVRFGGTTPYAQKVFYVNLQEIKGIKFGTTNPVNYFDSFYNSELFLRAFGTYSIKVVDPIKFYTEAIPKNAEHVDISDINEQYLSEFLGALQAAINQMSADGVRISHVTSKNMELSRYIWKWYRWVWLACPTRRRARSSSICAIRVLCSVIPMSGKAMSRARLPVAWRLLVPTLPAVWQALWAWALE